MAITENLGSSQQSFVNLESDASSTQSGSNGPGEAENNSESNPKYRSYPQRWGLMISVALLNISNYAMWISFASVNSKASVFYDTTEDNITRILVMCMIIRIPLSIFATILVTKFGLRLGIYVGGCLTFLGGLISCLSTFPSLRDFFSPFSWYLATLIGQVISAVGSPFTGCLTTHISQSWFQDKERIIATSVLGLSVPIGMLIGQAVTPLFVQDATQIPRMNVVWFVPSIFGIVLVFATVRTSKPPSPPSRSAEMELVNDFQHGYFSSIKSLSKNFPFVILLFSLSGEIGYLSGLQGNTEKVMCSLGYDNIFSGLCSALIYVSGIGGALIFGILSRKFPSNNLLLIRVSVTSLGIICLVLMFVMQMKNQMEIFAISYTLFGFFSVGIYPLMLELAVEVTYPLPESIVTALVGVTSSIQGVLTIQMVTPLQRTVANLDSTVSSCKNMMTESIQDYSYYVYFLNGYGILLAIVGVFFKPHFGRSEVDEKLDGDTSTKSTTNTLGQIDNP